MAILNKSQREAILDRERSATPGPWETRFLYRAWKCWRKHAREDGLLCENNEEADWPDSAFMAHARTDIPDLLETCEHLERRIAGLEAQLAQVHGLPEGKCR